RAQQREPLAELGERYRHEGQAEELAQPVAPADHRARDMAERALNERVGPARPGRGGAEVDEGEGVDQAEEAHGGPGGEDPDRVVQGAGDDAGRAHDPLADHTADHNGDAEADAEDAQEIAARHVGPTSGVTRDHHESAPGGFPCRHRTLRSGRRYALRVESRGNPSASWVLPSVWVTTPERGSSSGEET